MTRLLHQQFDKFLFVIFFTEYYARGMNHFPFWIYRKYNLKTLRREIVYAQYMLQGKPGDEESLRDLNSNDCPIQFSYRIAAQMIVADDERQTLLEASHESRLRWCMLYGWNN